MNPVNHAAAALLIRNKWPRVPIVPLLIGTLLVEIAWSVFNLFGIELTELREPLLAINDIKFDGRYHRDVRKQGVARPRRPFATQIAIVPYS